MANMTTSIIMELVDRVTRPVRRIQQALSGLGRRAGLDRLAGAARRAGNAMGNVVGQARALGERFLMMGGLAAGAVWGTERLVSGVTDVGTAVQESAERLRVGTTWLQEWQYVGKQFGVENDALVDGLKELGLRADEFVMTAGGPAAEAFGRLGIGLEDLRATGGNTAEMFDLVRSRMGRLENDAARQRVMDEIFGGQGGEQMVAMLGAANEELEKIMQRGRERGAILTPEEIKNSRDYTNQMGDLRQMLFGIQVAVVGELLPAINEWVERMGLLGQANREAVATDIIDGIREIWRGIQLVGTAVSWAADRVGGFGNLIAILAGLLAGRFLIALIQSGMAVLALGRQLAVFAARGVFLAATALVSLTRGLIGLAARAVPAMIAGLRVLSIALLTTPIGWIITGITAVAGLAYLLYRNWDTVGPWFRDMWEGIKEFFSQGIGDIVKDLLSFSPAALLLRGIDEVFELFGARPLTDIGRDWISGLWSGIEERWGQLTSWLSQKMDSLTSWLPDWAQDGLGLEGLGAPQASGSPEAALGAPVANERGAVMSSAARTDVGGELRIILDSENRPRVAETRQNGGMDFYVESGMHGVMP
tara:strand:+ start:2625 stop:4403 length:1779 start_codon:yes stop_codon:yes gene_type:complete